MSDSSRRTSPWIYVLFGCGLTALAIGLVVVGIGYFGYRWAEETAATMEDPETRRAATLELLGADELPDGYHAVMTMSMPFVVRMAMLSDRPPREDGTPEEVSERGFIYIDMIDFGDDRDTADGEPSGSAELDDVSDNTSIDFDSEVELRRGRIVVEGTGYHYSVHRGEVDFEETKTGAEAEGLQTLLVVDCPGRSKRFRSGIWFGPDPSPETPAEELELTGTVGDEEELTRFLGHFRPCPE